ncbi:DUF2147 domain-containing protein [Hyphomicrobium sp. LHD-15]|uniref:DUF2147 domain-containing protein n=1 Tax=Hyphomicrobium sp. LHD-15 TaxID=3072142 RepID=UPI00280D8016|nr:DUF2147 domain-containing protein [Hyphomicrobium sp. LHD-15]MDQ8697975.1 DUF2147 domain-containing protein [Hyphomicrobium sp. LHD-15]
MPIERHVLRIPALAALLLAASPAMAADEPLGVWVNDTGRGAIEIKPCGDKLCGHVVWVKDTADVEGCGRQIIGDLTSSGGGAWGGDNAWIYSPEKKKKYDVEVTPQKDGTLKVMGYAGVKFLSKTMVWTKAPADLVRCSTQEAAVPAPGSADPKGAATNEAAPDDKAAPKNDETNVAKNDKESVDLNGLKEQFGDVFKRDGKGNCKVDLPWVKVDFECKGDGEKK